MGRYCFKIQFVIQVLMVFFLHRKQINCEMYYIIPMVVGKALTIKKYVAGLTFIDTTQSVDII